MASLSLRHLSKTYDNGVNAIKDVTLEQKVFKFFNHFDNDSLLLFIFNSLSNFVILDKGFAHEKSILFYFHFSSCYN